jgi:hypothetical protein
MSQTSPRLGRRRFPDAPADNDPLDPLYARDAIANNLLHLADQAHSKVWINDMAVVEALQDGNDGSIPSVTSSSDEWRTAMMFGPFDLSVFSYRGQRVAYRVRPMIYATSENLTWAVRLCLPDETTSILDATGTAPYDWLEYTSTGSASPAWLASASAYDLIEPTRGLIDRAISSLPTNDVDGGVATVAEVVSVCVRVCCRGTGTDSLAGVFVAEYLVIP